MRSTWRRRSSARGAWSRRDGVRVGRHRVRRLMHLMGLEALAPKPGTSRPAPGHRIYPYLLRGLTIERPNQVWAADITYIPMARGFFYLVAIIDWRSLRNCQRYDSLIKIGLGV